MKVPVAKKLPSGSWRCQVMVDGRRVSVTGRTEKEAIAEAMQIKAGMQEAKKREKRVTVDEAIQGYMDAGSNVLSPATLRGYDIMRRNRFQSLMKRDVRTLTRLDIQKAVNYEAGKVAPKTVINAWGLLRPVLKDYGMVFEGIKLPQKIKKKKTYLSMDESTRLSDAAVGDDCEIQIVMAVWLGLRRSEIMGLCWDCVDLERGTIEIRRAMVPDKENKWVIKEGAKNESSQRTLKCPAYIMDKLKEIYHGQTGRVFQGSPETLRKHVHQVCKLAGIQDTTVHGLRHANAAVMVALNVVDKYAMARNGWTSDYTFKQVYAYVFPEGAEETDDLVNSFFESRIAGK